MHAHTTSIQTGQVLQPPTPREEKIMKMRFGLEDDSSCATPRSNSSVWHESERTTKLAAFPGRAYSRFAPNTSTGRSSTRHT
jgi:hypothetical protein